ncbi:MAG TPA: glycosyltransferase family 9 protein [Melioribacteraceae bacterium]|nr:glycosyltransferase family 9 protein [Melioribacteraceae bacterium]
MKDLLVVILNLLFGQKKIPLVDKKNIKNVLIIRQHNQFGDLLASSSLFVAFKESLQYCRLTVVVSPQNFYAISKNNYIDEKFVFDKKKLLSISYLISLKKILRKNYDLAVVPSTVSLSLTSSLLGNLSGSKYKLGLSELDGKTNKYSFLFNYGIKLDWRQNPDRHVADFILDVVRPLGINTTKFNPIVSIDTGDIEVADEFVNRFWKKGEQLLIGLHIGAGKPKNRWSLNKYIQLTSLIDKNFNSKFYITGSKADIEEIEYFKANSKIKVNYFIDRTIPQLAALISKSDLFITNDTGVMHVAGSTTTPQISIFGPTNPFNWAPLGKNKYFIRDKTELIDAIDVEEVFNLCKKILEKKDE